MFRPQSGRTMVARRAASKASKRLVDAPDDLLAHGMGERALGVHTKDNSTLQYR
jgi:hypothetical protein